MLLALKIALAEVMGWIILIPACVCHAWTDPVYDSSKPKVISVTGQSFVRPRVDQWKWQWLNPWYANIEDGVSGQQALIYLDGNGVMGPYMPEPNVRSRFAPALLWVWDSYRAYCWSALRNGANNAKRPLRHGT